MVLSGPFTEGCMNSGTVYLTIKDNAPNEMKIIYLSNTDIVVGECPIDLSKLFLRRKAFH